LRTRISGAWPLLPTSFVYTKASPGEGSTKMKLSCIGL
jgi:hypothetical protein